MEILEQTKTTEIQSIANDINKGIEAFEMRKAELIELASQAEGLDIESIDDRESIREVTRLRKDLKSARVEIQKEGKAMRDPLTGISKFIIEKEKELVAIIEPVEQDLKSKEDWVKAEKERIAEEERRREEKKINKRINALAELGFKIDYSDLKVMTDEEFDELLNEAQERYQEEQEAKRIEEERQAEERKKIEAERAALEKQRREAEEREAKIKAEQEKIEAEKRALEEAKRKAELDKQRQIDIEKAKKEAAEKARKEALAEAKAKEEARLDRERKAKERAELKAAMAPDKEKIEAYMSAVLDVSVPELKSNEAEMIMNDIHQRIEIAMEEGRKLLESI